MNCRLKLFVDGFLDRLLLGGPFKMDSLNKYYDYSGVIIFNLHKLTTLLHFLTIGLFCNLLLSVLQVPII